MRSNQVRAAKPRDERVTSRIMSSVRSTDTRPELLLRTELYRRGLRYRKHVRSLSGRPDLVFQGPRVVVFVDGDFFHGNSWRLRGFARFEDQFNHQNGDYWRTKIAANMVRDVKVNRALRRQGWSVIRVWESDVLRSPGRVADRIERVVRRRQGASSGDERKR
jgi:DNA mismatch endonuclease (patch repair protein)